jgi:hypothetical protein
MAALITAVLITAVLITAVPIAPARIRNSNDDCDCLTVATRARIFFCESRVSGECDSQGV